MTFITIFIASKPFTDPHVTMIQRNALRSWKELGLDVEVFLIGAEAGAAETAAELGLRFFPKVRRNQQDTPLLSSMFDIARQNSDSPLLAYVNADILLLPNFLESARQAFSQSDRFLLVGQRWDLDVRQPLEFSPGWQDKLMADVRQRGRLHPRGGSDYFIYPRNCFQKIPNFAIGRSGWDNWMFYEARSRGWQLVDCTDSIQIIHQDHDYNHLPGGKAHYRQPESVENVRLAGGRRHIFNLLDVNRCLVKERIVRPKLTWQKFWREVEIFPLVRLHSKALAQIFFAVFHPYKAYGEFRTWQAKRSGG
jgi:hypothetical protein